MKPHLYFKNPQEGLTEYKQRPGGGKKTEMPHECGVAVATEPEQKYHSANRNLL